MLGMRDIVERVKPEFEQFKKALVPAAQAAYGRALITLALYGSWARGTATPESDIDLLLVADPLPDGRFNRLRQFEAIDRATQASCKALWGGPGLVPELSPLIKTPAEVEAGSPLFLDMTDWCDILLDNDDYFAGWLAALRERMRINGSERRPFKGGYYWVYKPSARPGEVVTL